MPSPSLYMRFVRMFALVITNMFKDDIFIHNSQFSLSAPVIHPLHNLIVQFMSLWLFK